MVEIGKGKEMSIGYLRVDKKLAYSPEGLVRHILQEIIITQTKNLITISTHLGHPSSGDETTVLSSTWGASDVIIGDAASFLLLNNMITTLPNFRWS